MVDNFAHIGFNRCFRHTVCSKYSANIFSKTQHFDFISFVRKDRQDRQTNILNPVVKTSRSANLRLPHCNDFQITNEQTRPFGPRSENTWLLNPYWTL